MNLYGAHPDPSRRVLEVWGPAILWAAFIFALSTQGFSGDETARWIELVARTILPGISLEGIEIVNGVLRKAAHASEYFVFFLLLDRAFRLGSAVARVPAPWLALAVAILYAFTDEVHQAFVGTRTPSLADCGLDSLGAAAAALFRAAGYECFRASR